MARRKTLRGQVCVWAAIAYTITNPNLRADDATETRQQVRELQKKNEMLSQQLRHQQELIESLTRKVSDIQEVNAKHGHDPELSVGENAAAAQTSSRSSAFSPGKVNIAGEGAVGFFNSGSKGMYPNAEFRVDEAKLFVETPIWGEVYFFGELNLMTRESSELNLRLGELYLDLENVSRWWHRDGMLSARLGQMYIPFGEEYLARYAIDNPLISHSIPDIWGVDQGIEFYGRMGKISYVLAVQNGGIYKNDFNADKAIAGRLAFDPTGWLHLSASGMRTGNLDAHRDQLSALWFGNGFFRSFGTGSATKFHADLVEGDMQVRWSGGHVGAFGGYARYDDNDPSANNRRDIYYYSLEGVQDLTPKLYAGIRFSQIFAEEGLPIVGNGNLSEYFFNTLTEEIWRLSLGLGYRWSPNLIFKGEYSFERGKQLGGDKRNHEDLFAIQAAFRF